MVQKNFLRIVLCIFWGFILFFSGVGVHAGKTGNDGHLGDDGQERLSSRQWSLLTAGEESGKRCSVLRDHLSGPCQQKEEVESKHQEMVGFLNKCNECLDRANIPFFVRSFSYLSPEVEIPAVGGDDDVSLDFEFVTNSQSSKSRKEIVFGIRSLQLLINRELYIYDFNKAPPSDVFISSLKSLCEGHAFKLIFGGEEDALLLCKLTGLSHEAFKNVLDIQKLILVLAGDRQLTNFEKGVERTLPFKLSDIEGYKKLSFMKWFENSKDTLSLEQMFHGAVDVVFLPVLISRLSLEGSSGLWSSYNAVMAQYYRKILGHTVQIVDLAR